MSSSKEVFDKVWGHGREVGRKIASELSTFYYRDRFAASWGCVYRPPPQFGIIWIYDAKGKFLGISSGDLESIKTRWLKRDGAIFKCAPEDASNK